MTRKQRRLSFIVTGLVVLGAAVGLVLNAFDENIVFFYTPSEVLARQQPVGQKFRLGGLVTVGSIAREAGSTVVTFSVTDFDHTIPVRYNGLLPNLFREGQGVVTEGQLDESGSFIAQSVLAKHDENYMPPEVAASLKEAGQWRDSLDMP